MIEPVDEFFDLKGFAEEAEYTPFGGSMTKILVIFDNEHSAVPLSGYEYSSRAPRAICREVDVEGVTKKATLLVKTVLYTVIDVQPDGHGLVDLILSKG